MFIPPINPGFFLGGAIGVGLAQKREYTLFATLMTALTLAYAAGSGYREIENRR